MGNKVAKADEKKNKPDIPSRDTDGYKVLSKKVEEIKMEERMKEYFIV
jgi:hypothetical protein